MPIVDYPFQAQGVFSQSSPILPILITNPHNGANFQTWGLVDTGAMATVIPGFIARSIGHNITVYPHTCSIDIWSIDNNGNVNENDVVIRIPSRSMGVINDCNCVLLGVNDFLKRYILKVNYPRKVFSIRHPRPPQPKKKIKHRRH